MSPLTWLACAPQGFFSDVEVTGCEATKEFGPSLSVAYFKLAIRLVQSIACHGLFL